MRHIAVLEIIFILKHFGMNSRSKFDAALLSRFEVRVELGCDRVANTVPNPSLLSVAEEQCHITR